MQLFGLGQEVLPLPQLVKLMHQHLSFMIISMIISVLLEAEVNPPQTLKHQMANTDNKEDSETKGLLAAAEG